MSPEHHPSPDPLHPHPGYAALRQHRWSAAGAEYFVATKAARPTTALANPALLTAIRTRIEQLEALHHWRMRIWVVMPDHIHLLFILGANITLAGCMRLFKGPLTPALREHNLRWAKLTRTEKRWSAYFCSAEDWRWFEPLANAGAPFPPWLE